MEKKLYPLKFIPFASRKPWGGGALVNELGKRFVELDEEGNPVLDDDGNHVKKNVTQNDAIKKSIAGFEYLKYLKTNGNFSWHDISNASGLPEATIRKIFSGETADPRFETVVRLVSAMGGSLDKINAIEKVENVYKVTGSLYFLSANKLIDYMIKELEMQNKLMPYTNALKNIRQKKVM